jgi:hypothetical protein
MNSIFVSLIHYASLFNQFDALKTILVLALSVKENKQYYVGPPMYV